jgi:undecaprenyl-diphosphatase
VRRPPLCLLLGLAFLILVGWAAGELWTSIVGSADLQAVRGVVEARSAGATAAMRVVTWAGSAFLLVPLAVACCAVLIRRGLYREAAVVALSLGGAILISDLVKLLVSRPRPPVEHLQAVSGSSFPSGHATQASAFWLSLVLALRAARAARAVTRLAAVIAVVLVSGVAFSRVYLGVHYPSDVIAGVLLGGAWAVFVARCLESPAVLLRARENV